MVSPGRRLGDRAMVLRLVTAALLALLPVVGLTAPASGAEPVGRLTGTITGEGATLATTWVTLTPVDDRGTATGPPQRAATDESGRYDFPQVPTGGVKVQARAPLLGTLVDTYWPQAFTFEGAGVIDITTGTVTADLDLPSGGSAQGKVVEARTGAPVVGARVTAHIAGEPPSGSVGIAGPVGEPGQFSLTGLPPVPLELSVSLPPDSPFLELSPGRSRSPESLSVDGGADTTGVTIGLRRSAVITGRVLDDAGAPVVGADVRLVGCLPECPPHAATDTTGTYRLEGVSAGTGLEVVAKPAWGLLGPWYPTQEATARVTDLAVGDGDALDSVDLTLTRPAFVSLDVLGADLAEATRVIVRLTTTGRTYSQYLVGRAIAEPTGTQEPGGMAGTAAGPPPVNSIRLKVGPVPPGEYSLGISTGLVDFGYLPTRWVTDSGTPSTPTIRLAPGEANRSVVTLAPGGEVLDEDVVNSEPDPPGAWPGLAPGFLDPTGWTDPLR
jgi:hypothetical protein